MSVHSAGSFICLSCPQTNRGYLGLKMTLDRSQQRPTWGPRNAPAKAANLEDLEGQAEATDER